MCTELEKRGHVLVSHFAVLGMSDYKQRRMSDER
jgi:hypothetical protein